MVMKASMTKVEARVGPNQGEEFEALGGPLGRGHGGHTLTLEGLRIMYMALEDLSVSLSKPMAEWFLGLSLKT